MDHELSPRDCYLEIRRQIVEESRRSWGLSDYGHDPKAFRTQCLVPLEQLQEVYGDLDLHYVYSFRRKSDEITSVHIVGVIDHLSVLKGV
jgi:hypothetical protein